MKAQSLKGKSINYKRKPKAFFNLIKVYLSLTDEYKSKYTYSLIGEYYACYRTFNLDQRDRIYAKALIEDADHLMKEMVYIDCGGGSREFQLHPIIKRSMSIPITGSHKGVVGSMSNSKSNIHTCLMLLKSHIYESVMYKISTKETSFKMPDALLVSNYFEKVKVKALDLIMQIDAASEVPSNSLSQILDIQVNNKFDLIWTVYYEAREHGASSFIDGLDADEVVMKLLGRVEKDLNEYDLNRIVEFNNHRKELLDGKGNNLFSSSEPYRIINPKLSGVRELDSIFGIRSDVYISGTVHFGR